MKKKTDQYQTTRIWKRTHQMLRLVAAMTHESIVELLDRLAKEELQRVKEQGERDELHL